MCWAGQSYQFFAAAVLANVAVRGATSGTQEVALLSFAHVASRGVSAFAYVADWTTVRTMGFLVGVVSNVALFIILAERL